jgi:hypothetical protein
LSANKLPSDFCFELAKVVGPVTLLQGPKTKGAIKTAAELTASYSDAKDGEVTVNYGKIQLDKSVKVSPPARTEVEKLRVGNKKRLLHKRKG